MRKTSFILLGASFCLALAASRTVVAAGGLTNSSSAEYVKAQAELGKAQAQCMMAQAELIRAQTEANLAAAQVQNTNQKTRSLVLDNKLKTVQTFFKKREINDSSRAVASPGDGRLPESGNSSERRMTNYAIDPVRGNIFWPATFCQKRFAKYRGQLDELFARRTQSDSGLGRDSYKQTQAVLKQMQAELRSVVREMSPTEYIAARKFLETVAIEARFSSQLSGVAAGR